MLNMTGHCHHPLLKDLFLCGKLVCAVQSHGPQHPFSVSLLTTAILWQEHTCSNFLNVAAVPIRSINVPIVRDSGFDVIALIADSHPVNRAFFQKYS